MSNTLNVQRLGSLLNSLYRVTGLKFALMDERTHEVYTSTYKTAFCKLIEEAPGGYDRCVACDKCHADMSDRDLHFETYICHAGLRESLVPVYDRGVKVATVMFGQVLDRGDRAEQWDEVRRLCSWYPDLEELHRAFLQLRQMDAEELQACTDIVRACVSEVRLTGLMQQSRKTDGQRLKEYLDAHYAENVTLDMVAQEIGVGRTKLCSVVKEATGRTFTDYVAYLRMNAAARMLTVTDLSVQYIAETVGIADYNYFTKVFRRLNGMPPTTYRKTYGKKAHAADKDAQV